jgi:hypothetical protein
MILQTNLPGIWPLPISVTANNERYELELCEDHFEARMRIYRGAVRTSAYILIPASGERPEGCPVDFWIKSQNFYNCKR